MRATSNRFAHRRSEPFSPRTPGVTGKLQKRAGAVPNVNPPIHSACDSGSDGSVLARMGSTR